MIKQVMTALKFPSLVRLGIVVPAVFALSACTALFFYPNETYTRTPAALGLAYEDVDIDGIGEPRLHGWFLPAAKPTCGTVLFLHGNAENISMHIASVYWLPARGFNVFLFDYRGYGASGGSPSLAGIQNDIDRAIRYLLQHGLVSPHGIVLFGQSLGASAAIYYAAHGEHRSGLRSVVVESPFASYRGIAQEKLAAFWLTWPLQWLPRWTMSDRYSPVNAIGQVAPIPLLLIHGDSDPIVPLAHSERLFAAAQEPKRFWKIVGGGHITAFTSAPMRARLTTYLHDQICPAVSLPVSADGKTTN